MKKARFISFEGGEGSGKTTQSKLLNQYLLSIGQNSIWTREPGGTRISEQIREFLINNDLKPITELLLVMAGRYEHMHELILPTLKKGEWVICDRFIDSSLCYQGIFKNLGHKFVQELHNLILNNFWPDLTFIIDTPVKISLSRLHNRINKDKYDSMPIVDHECIYKCFNNLASLFPNRVALIDGTKDSYQIHDEIIKHLQQRNWI